MRIHAAALLALALVTLAAASDARPVDGPTIGGEDETTPLGAGKWVTYPVRMAPLERWTGAFVSSDPEARLGCQAFMNGKKVDEDMRGTGQCVLKGIVGARTTEVKLGVQNMGKAPVRYGFDFQ